MALLAIGFQARGSRAQVMVAGDSLSIAECGRIAREMAPLVRISELERRAAALDSAAAARNRRPAFAVFGGASLAPKGFYDPVLTNLGQYELKAGIEWTLVDGRSREIARARAANDAALAAVESERAKREAALRAGDLAVEILRLRERERAQLSWLEWLDRLGNIVQSGVRAGVRGQSDALRVTLERGAVQSALASTRADLEVTGRELGQLLARPGAAALAVRAPAAEEDRPPAGTDSAALAAGLANLPGLRSARLGEARRRLDVAETAQRNALRLATSADAGLFGSDLTTSVPPDVRAGNPDATFGDRLRHDLGASLTLGFKKPVADAAARPLVQAREADREAATLRLDAETETQRRLGLDLLSRWRTAAQRLATANADAARAETHLLRLKSLYAGGAASLLELLDSRTLYNDVLERLAGARAETRSARFESEFWR